MDKSQNRDIALVPKKSRREYVAAWNNFVHFVNKYKFQDIDDPEVILLHFEELRPTQSPPTLGKIWSMLKKCFMAFKRINCKEIKYELISTWLKYNGAEYTSSQAPIFTKDELIRFLSVCDEKLLKYQLSVGLMWYGM